MANAKVGDVVGGFELERQLGAGGLTTIWQARTPSGRAPRRRAVVKVMHDHLSAQKELRDLFIEEGKLAQRLEHPNIVKVLDVGVEKGRCFLCMELVDGVDLRSALEANRGPLAPGLAAALLADACKALGYAHKRGVVHRDVAADNVMVDVSGRVLVLDFGIGRAQGFRGADPALDVLGLGRTLENLVTGRDPADDAEDTQPAGQPKPNLPKGLGQVLARATAPAPKQRYASAAELEAALRDALRALPAPSPKAIGQQVELWKTRIVEAQAAAAEQQRAQQGEVTMPIPAAELSTEWEVDTDPQREPPLPSVMLAPDLEAVAERHLGAKKRGKPKAKK